MLTLYNFRNSVSPAVLKRAKNYFDEGKVGVSSLTPDLSIKVTVKGTQDYRVVIKLDKSGNILNTKCDCPYEYGGLCKHITAVLLTLEKRLEPVPDFRSNPESNSAPKPVTKPAEAPSSREIHSLIAEYKQSDNNEKKETVSPSEKIRLEPILHFDTRKHKLELSLKIGSGKMYKVRDIKQLYFDFLDGNYTVYGKSLAFTHRIDRLDGQSGRLLKIIGSAEPVSNYYYGKKDTVYVSGMYLDDLFELYRDNGVLIDEKSFSVKFEDPSITFSLKRNPDDRFTLKTNCKLKLIGAGLRSYFIDEKAQTVFAADPQFTRAVCKLYETVHGSRSIRISEKDMPKFYSAVLKKAADHIKINGLELIGEFIPPELAAQLYIDCGEDNAVYADLMFCYNENTYNGFAENNSPHYDEPGETAAKNAVLRYFEIRPGHDHRSLVITDDSAAYELITSGLTALSEIMELYISDKFRRMIVRPPVKPRVGVRLSAGILELDISDDNYSQEELSEILKAYHTGAKYRRLKDGSFAVIGETLPQLAELAQNLDLTDKDLMKKKLKIPAYRMLYLDSLQNRADVRMSYNEEFKKSVSDYRKSIEDPESLSVLAYSQLGSRNTAFCSSAENACRYRNRGSPFGAYRKDLQGEIRRGDNLLSASCEGY